MNHHPVATVAIHIATSLANCLITLERIIKEYIATIACLAILDINCS